jgi:hypothetical protein
MPSTRLPRSRLGAVLRLVSALCATSDKAPYVNLATLDIAGLAALRPGNTAYLLPEPALGVRERVGAARICHPQGI